MKKIITFLKNNETILIILIIMVVVISEIFQKTLEPLDDLWDFGNIYKLSIGKTIYKDVNIIVTPIFFIIGKIMFLVFERNYCTFLLYGSIIVTLIYILIYRLFKTLKIKNIFTILFTLFLMILSYPIIGNGTNYNMLGMLFVLLGILYSIKNAETPRKYNYIVQAIFIVLIFLTMQKLGVRLYYKLYNI